MTPRILKKDIALKNLERTPEQDEERSARLGVAVKFVSLLILFGAIFLLVQSMVQHHFFTGGAQNYHNSPTGP